VVVVLPRHGVAYFPMRKVASTSVKAALQEAFDGPGEYRATAGVPMSARQKRLAQGCHVFTIVRDPISRLLSCYGNRVCHHRDLTAGLADRMLLRLSGLDPDPDIDTFFLNLAGYRRINDKVRRHSRLQIVSLGSDLGFFDAIYRISELDRLAQDLTDRTGRPVAFGRKQTGGPKFSFSDLSRPAQEALLAFAAEDYALLKDYFTPPRTS